LPKTSVFRTVLISKRIKDPSTTLAAVCEQILSLDDVIVKPEYKDEFENLYGIFKFDPLNSVF